jgi:hypothetical protein
MRSEVVVVVARLVSSRLGAQAVAGKRRNGSGRLEEKGREANRGSCECECEYESNESGRTATTVVEKADVFYMARFEVRMSRADGTGRQSYQWAAWHWHWHLALAPLTGVQEAVGQPVVG